MMIGMPVCGVCGKDWPKGVRVCPTDGHILAVAPPPPGRPTPSTAATTAAPAGADRGRPPAGPPAAHAPPRSAPSEPPVPRNAPSDPPQRKAPSDAPVVVAQTALAAIPPSELDLKPGTMVGEYRIDGKIGEGGMAVVYGATHPLIGKKAAIKVMSPALSTNAEAIRRFRQEARSVNQIGHLHIVDIFSFGSLPDGRS